MVESKQIATEGYQAAVLEEKYGKLADEHGLREQVFSPSSTGRGPAMYNGDTYRPGTELQHEQARHRLMLYLVAQGKSNTEVAEIVGVTSTTVSNTKRQPWFQERLAAVLAESGQQMLDTLLKGEALESLQTLVELRDDKSQKGSVRASCAFGLLEHTIGKAVQRTETDVKVKHTYETIHQVDAELAKLEEEERQLKVVNIQQNVA